VLTCLLHPSLISGSGKTYLLKKLVDLLGLLGPVQSRIVSINGSYSKATFDSIFRTIGTELLTKDCRYFVILDEMSSTREVEYCKAALVDRTINGQCVDRRMTVLATANPHDSRAGYNVHPLPKSLLQVAIRFDTVGEDTMLDYLRARPNVGADFGRAVLDSQRLCMHNGVPMSVRDAMRRCTALAESEPLRAMIDAALGPAGRAVQHAQQLLALYLSYGMQAENKERFFQDVDFVRREGGGALHGRAQAGPLPTSGPRGQRCLPHGGDAR
jgi:hypothetical protein